MLEPVISCARNQHSNSVPQRHWSQISSLIDTNSYFSDLSDSLNSIWENSNKLNLTKSVVPSQWMIVSDFVKQSDFKMRGRASILGLILNPDNVTNRLVENFNNLTK